MKNEAELTWIEVAKAVGVRLMVPLLRSWLNIAEALHKYPIATHRSGFLRKSASVLADFHDMIGICLRRYNAFETSARRRSRIRRGSRECDLGETEASRETLAYWYSIRREAVISRYKETLY